MDAETCFEDVRRIGDLISTAEARTATDAVLGVLGERLGDDGTDDLATQLPEELAEPLGGGQAASFSREVFLDRVADRAEVDYETARLYARSVFAVLDDVAPGELTRARERLPDDFDLLFESGTPMSAAEFREVVAGQLDVEADPKTLTTVVLATLGERLSAGEAEDLATYLPQELRGPLVESASESPPAFGVEEFFSRVADRAPMTEEDAEPGSQAVAAVLADAAGDHEIGAARSQLPGEYDRLFALADRRGSA